MLDPNRFRACLSCIVVLLALIQATHAIASGDLQTTLLAFCDQRGQAVPNVLVASPSTSHLRIVFTANANASVSSFSVAGAVGSPVAAACGDFRGLGRSNIAVYYADTAAQKVYILDGVSLTVNVTISLNSTLFPGNVSLAAGDVNNDGAVELVVGSHSTHALAVYSGSGVLLRTFTTFGNLVTGGVTLDVGDVNADGIPEIVVAQTVGHEIEVLSIAGIAANAAPTVVASATATVGTGVNIKVSPGTPATPGALVYSTFSPVAANVLAIHVFTGSLSATRQLTFGASTAYNNNALRKQLQSLGTAPTTLVLAAAQLTYPPPVGSAKVEYPPLFPAIAAAISSVDTVFVGCSGTEYALDTFGAWYGPQIQPPCVVAPSRNYVSPYYVSFPDASLVQADFSSGPRGNRSLWATLDYADWYTQQTRVKVGTWGPQPNVFSVPNGLMSWTTAQIQQRYLASIANLIGTTVYQHHHVPSWIPNSQQWDWGIPVTTGAHFAGLDCSDLTAWGWNFGFGLQMTAATAPQGELPGVPCPWCSNSNQQVVFTTVAKSGISFHDLVATLQPGDMLYIKGNEGSTSPVTHVISWLGEYGKCKAYVTGECPALIIDSHGQEVMDSMGIMVASGPHIRPFLASEWYFNSFSHAVRLVNSKGFVIGTTNVQPSSSAAAVTLLSSSLASLVLLMLTIIFS